MATVLLRCAAPGIPPSRLVDGAWRPRAGASRDEAIEQVLDNVVRGLASNAERAG